MGSGILSIFFNIFFGKAALLRDFLNELAVIAGDAQPGGHLFADGSAAAAKFPADGNYTVRDGSHFHFLGLSGTFSDQGLFEPAVQRHRNETGDGIGNGLHPHQAGNAKEGVQGKAEGGEDHTQTEHCQQQGGLPLAHRLEDGVVHVEQAHADDAPGPAAHKGAAHFNDGLVGREHPHNDIGNELHNGQEDDGENQQNQKGQPAYCVNPLVILGAVAVADEGHDALGNTDADVQGDGTALGGDAVGGREDIAPLMPQQQAVQNRDGHRHQQHRQSGGKTDRQGTPGHVLLQRNVSGGQGKHRRGSHTGQHHKEIDHGNGVGQHGGNGGAGHIHLKHKDKYRVQNDIQNAAHGQPNAGLFGFAHGAHQVAQGQAGYCGQAANHKDPEQIVAGETKGKFICAKEPQNGTHKQGQQDRQHQRHRQTAPEAEGAGLFCGKFLVLSQASGNDAVGANAKQIGHRRQQRVDGKGDGQGGQLVGVANLPDEKGVGQAVQNDDDLADHRRNGQLGHRLAYRHGGKQFVVFLS